ncbi:hypothetical protein KSS87_018753 [Heliosperma pusillum]|nr:hypothetical protein KSS87_018753 [Heliosperma pusillum]
MSSLLYQLFTSTTLTTLSLYHLTTSIHTYLKSPTTFLSKPYHPLPLPNLHLRRLPLYLTFLSLLTSILHHLLSSTLTSPLLPTHPYLSLTSSLTSFLFLLSLLLPFPNSLSFASVSASFYLLSLSSLTLTTPSLSSHLYALSSRVSRASSAFSLLLAINPRLFLADVALSGSVLLQGLWAVQTGLSLYVDAFVPEGCHKLLDVVGGVEGSTKCEVDEARVRAVAILDLMFVVYVVVVVLVVFIVYAVVGKVIGVGNRRFGSYEALPNVAVDGSVGVGAGVDAGHVQLKALSGVLDSLRKPSSCQLEANLKLVLETPVVSLVLLTFLAVLSVREHHVSTYCYLEILIVGEMMCHSSKLADCNVNGTFFLLEVHTPLCVS